MTASSSKIRNLQVIGNPGAFFKIPDSLRELEKNTSDCKFHLNVLKIRLSKGHLVYLMKKTILISFVSLSAGISAMAGSYVSYGKAPKGPMPLQVPSLCECFNANTANFSVFGAAILPENVSPDFDDSLGGGLAMSYFFSEYLGVEGSYSIFGTDSAVHQLSGSLILRFPIRSLCLAPYVFTGGSFHTDGVNQSTLHAGGGLDYRFTNCVGIFADAQYNWAEDTSDYTTVRTGVRFGF